MKVTNYTVNEIGLNEIRSALLDNHKFGPDHQWSNEQLCAWARDVEFSLGEGNDASFEIRSFDTWKGQTMTFTLSTEALDQDEIEVE